MPILEVAQQIWEFTILDLRVVVGVNALFTQIAAFVFAAGLVGYVETPAEFEFRQKDLLSTFYITREIGKRYGYTDEEISEMRELLSKETNNKMSPPEDWPYEIPATEIYQRIYDMDPPMHIYPVVTESQIVWMVVGTVLLGVSAILPMLNGVHVVLPMIAAVLFACLITYQFFNFEQDVSSSPP